MSQHIAVINPSQSSLGSSPSLLDIVGTSVQDLHTRGLDVLRHKDDSVFVDVETMMSHPLFREFQSRYFNDWKSIQLIVSLCRIYEQLDSITPRITPYEKLAVLQTIVTDELIGGVVCKSIESVGSVEVVIPPVESKELVSTGQSLYKTNQMYGDIANVMEHELIKDFITKYFIRWNTGDIVVVLIKMYECVDSYNNFTREQKLGFLQYLLSNKVTRHQIANKIEQWKKM